MKLYYTIISLFFLTFTLNTAYAIDNPDAPDLINQFKEREKVYLQAIENPANGTRESLRAYHDYKIFLDKELNKTYRLLKSKLPPERQAELTVSQRHWLEFRDAEFKLINNNWDRATFGSSFAISRGEYSSMIIKNRLMQLFHYLANYL
jgi:uncharacterized protein YecT (DUF1311 family)